VTVGMVLRRTSNYPPYLCAAHGHYTVKEITPRGTVVVEVGGYEGLLNCSRKSTTICENLTKCCIINVRSLLRTQKNRELGAFPTKSVVGVKQST
jgi:hypothetical protein